MRVATALAESRGARLVGVRNSQVLFRCIGRDAPHALRCQTGLQSCVRVGFARFAISAVLCRCFVERQRLEWTKTHFLRRKDHRYDFFGGSSRMNDHDTSARWPLL